MISVIAKVAHLNPSSCRHQCPQGQKEKPAYPGWDSFQRAIEMRNRITHPRTPEDLNLSKEDFNHIELGATWFSDNIENLINQFAERLKKLKKAFDDAKKPASPA